MEDADCRLQIADCRLQIADCRWHIVCCLLSAVCLWTGPPKRRRRSDGKEVPMLRKVVPGVVIGEDADGSTARIGVGDTVEIVLTANPSTGFTWEVVGLDETVVRQTGE